MKPEKKLFFIIIFNITLMVLEIVGSVFSRSLALLSDAGHMLTDTTALAISYAAIYIAKRPSTHTKTFGWRRIEVLAALINGLLLCALAVFILRESVLRIFSPVEIKAKIMLFVAAVGLAGNFIGLFLLRGYRKDNINLKGAYYHIFGDMLSSVGVLIGGVLIFFTGLGVIDSLVGILIAGIILKSAVGLIFESSNILLESAPSDIAVLEVVAEVKKIAGVMDFHDVHIWSISSASRSLSGHILIRDIKASESQKILDEIRQMLKTKFKIDHTTLEVECEKCNDRECYASLPAN